jgi:CheY-like chemotaxis protein
VTQPIKDIQPGTYAVLSISDTGAGISKEEIDRIFEPFYTKKIMGRSGTGLGLTVVWNTVQDHNGYVVVENKQNFTTFDMYFPVTRKMTPVQIKKVSAGDLKGNGERILLVDDDPNQRDITGEMLKALGYHVAAADSGEAAVDKIRKNPFDLVVLDMIMPGGMNGLETYKEVLKIKAAQKAIIASGFSVNDDVKAAQRLGAGQFLKKPFAMEALARAVKNELIRN